MRLDVAGLQIDEAGLGAAYFDLAGVFFDVERLDHAVFGVQRKTLGAQAHAERGGVELQAQGLGERAVAIGKLSGTACSHPASHNK